MAELYANLPVPGSKRRRLRGSCDICKQRKIRCDSAQMPNNRCSNCIAFNSECTHSTKAASKKSNTASQSASSPDNSESHKTGQAHVSSILLQSTEYIPAADIRQVLVDVAHYARSLEQELASCRRSHSLPISDSPISPANFPSPAVTKEEEDDAIFINGTLTSRFERFILDSDRNRFFGKSSHVALIKTAMDVKKANVEDEALTKQLPSTRRPQFWESPWEHFSPDEVLSSLVFPEPDLLQSLVSIYFKHISILFPLLHRPTFEKSLATGLHVVDRQFGATVLGVCAAASKYCHDPRVIFKGTNTQLSSGWEYYRQLQPVRTSLTGTATLYEAQLICLCVLYLQGSSVPEGCWILGGAGVRYAQDVGVHRRNRFDDQVLNEQWKRVFWMLICIDTLGSSFCGRPRATSSDDYDLDYPIECDDEFWDHPDPAMAFKQPSGRPSTMTYTTVYLKLIEIVGMTQRTVYSIKRESKPAGWTKGVLAELDAVLSAWMDSVPEHLRWDPHMEDPTFFAQSAALYACYYHVQMQIHRLFVVSSPIHSTSLSYNYPSLAICANSARSCCHIVDVACRRGLIASPHVLNAIFDSGVVLLLNVWGGRQAGLSTDPRKCLQDVDICLRLLGVYEKKWHVAGRQHDIITELMSATNIDWQFSPNPLKRRLDDDPDRETSAPDSARPAEVQESTGTDAVPSLTQMGQPSGELLSFPDIDPLFTLPLYTEDLGRLPVYEPFNWVKDSALPATGYQNEADSSLGSVGGMPPLPDTTGSNMGFSGDLAMLTETPADYEWADWGKYITSVEELMHSLSGTA
ncbi:fungal-specific transcription factor domain-containing protein [Mycena sp. CBHHK59/15]|nr:fungal-specific transcription factor domain-containing protein [Mycena sp. CBHHK59/15]